MIMGLRNLFRKHDAQTRTCWGYTFQWTDDHFTPEEFHSLKYSFDILGHEALERLNAISPPFTEPPKLAEGDLKLHPNSTKPSKRDLYALLRDNAEEDEVLGRLWKQVNTVPDWVDVEQIARGQDVFYRYGGGAVTGLTFQSLVGGMVGQPHRAHDIIINS